jgi:hypothetical protein
MRKIAALVYKKLPDLGFGLVWGRQSCLQAAF